MGITHSQEIYQKIFPHYLDFNSYIWLILCEGQDFKFYSHYFKNIYVALLFFFLIIIYMLRSNQCASNFFVEPFASMVTEVSAVEFFYWETLNSVSARRSLWKLYNPWNSPELLKQMPFLLEKQYWIFFCGTLWSVNQQMPVNFAIFITKAFNWDWTSLDFWITWFSPWSERDNLFSVASTNNPRNFICIFG